MLLLYCQIVIVAHLNHTTTVYCTVCLHQVDSHCHINDQWLLIHCILTVRIPFYVFLGKEQIKPRVQVMFILISIELTCRKHH